MTTPVTDHPLVQRYLQALDRLLVDLEPSERAEIVEGVRDHLADDLADDAGSDDVQAALARVGPVEAIAEEATRGRPSSVRESARPVPGTARGWVPNVVMALQLVALGFVLMVAVQAPGTWRADGGDVSLAAEYGDVFAPALLANMLWWPSLALLAGMSPLWTTWEWVHLVSAVPAVALLFDVAPVLGWHLDQDRGMTVASIAALVVGVGVWLYTVWWLPHLARLRVELFRARATGA